MQVIETAHNVGLNTTATIMFGHVDGPRNWARHLIAIRDLQQRTGGITEFVPLPFVHMEAPIYLKGGALPRLPMLWQLSMLWQIYLGWRILHFLLGPLLQLLQHLPPDMLSWQDVPFYWLTYPTCRP